jgi:thiamine-phosphate pyrophosphorylase
MNRSALAVYPILDLLPGTPLDRAAAVAAAALRGGATLLQLRQKREGAGELVALARALRPRLDETGVALVINDQLAVALEAGAAGVHLGQRDLPVRRARELATAAGRAELVIGVSVTTAVQARRALAEGASYLSVSPVFGTATKPDLERPVGGEGVRRIRRALPGAPIVAIGGITPARVAEVIEAGADGVAFVSALGVEPESAVRGMAAVVAAALRERAARSVALSA